MNYHRKIELENWPEVSRRVESYLASNPHWLKNGIVIQLFPIVMDVLTASFAKWGIEIKDVILIVCYEDLLPHVDRLATNAPTESLIRVNIPITNCNGTITYFHKWPEDFYWTVAKGLKTGYREAKTAEVVDSYSLTSPTIINGAHFHSVKLHGHMSPRVALTISAKNPQRMRELLDGVAP